METGSVRTEDQEKELAWAQADWDLIETETEQMLAPGPIESVEDLVREVD